MYKIVAVGGGCYADGEIVNIFEHIVSLSDKEKPRVVFLPTAGFDDINGDDVILEGFRSLGCTTDTLLLTNEALGRAEIEARIFAADIVYAGGGNLKFLADTWQKTGADEILKAAGARGTVLSGYSSGAMCWFERGYDDCGENGSFMFVDCLGILPFCNCPHFESGNWQSFAEAVKEQPLSGIACDNGAAFCFVDGKYYTLQGNDGGDVWFFDSKKGYQAHIIDDSTSISSSLL